MNLPFVCVYFFKYKRKFVEKVTGRKREAAGLGGLIKQVAEAKEGPLEFQRDGQTDRWRESKGMRLERRRGAKVQDMPKRGVLIFLKISVRNLN